MRIETSVPQLSFLSSLSTSFTFQNSHQTQFISPRKATAYGGTAVVVGSILFGGFKKLKAHLKSPAIGSAARPMTLWFPQKCEKLILTGKTQNSDTPATHYSFFNRLMPRSLGDKAGEYVIERDGDHFQIHQTSGRSAIHVLVGDELVLLNGDQKPLRLESRILVIDGSYYRLYVGDGSTFSWDSL